MTDTIIITAPAGTKSRWVHLSQKSGMKLSDWIVKNVESRMQSSTTITIPPDLSFADLKMARSADGSVSFDTSIINRIEAASGLPVGYYMARQEDALAELLTSWYSAHLAAGGAPDPTYADLVGEVQAENAAGQRSSLPPGRS